MAATLDVRVNDCQATETCWGLAALDPSHPTENEQQFLPLLTLRLHACRSFN